MTTVELAPPPPATGRPRRLAAPVAAITGLGLATLAVALRDPHQQGSWGICPSAALGFSCPGCGGLRAVHDLTHGRFLDAASSNLVVVVGIPIAVAVLLRWLHLSWQGRPRSSSALTGPLLTVAAMALLVFTVLRNLPGLEWLAP